MSAARVVFPHPPLPQTLDRLSNNVTPVVNEHTRAWTHDELIAQASEADALVAYMTERIDQQVLAACPRLRIVAGALKGYDNIDVDACTDNGVWVTAVPDLLTRPTAELAIGMMISLGRHLRSADRYMRDGMFTGWNAHFYGIGLDGSQVGIVGMGAIGRAIAERLSAFDAEVHYTDPQQLADDDHLARTCHWRPLNDLLASSQFVVLAAPLTEQTQHLINRDTLEWMRDDALLINPARGSLVDEQAVGEALHADKLGGYAADVFEMEDLSRSQRPEDIPDGLRRHDRTLLTPHLGSAVTDSRAGIERRAVENIQRVLAGWAPMDPVNTPKSE